MHSERWTTIKDDAENVEQEAKRGKYDPEFHGEPDLSDSSGDEDLETAIFNRGSTQVDDCEDSFNLGDDVDFLSAMNDDIRREISLMREISNVIPILLF